MEEEIAEVKQEMSKTIGELAKALSKAQGEMMNAKKDSNNPFFKSKYADLTSVIEASREALVKNELAIIQTCSPTRDGVCIITTLMHASGEWIRGSLFMAPTKNDPQGLGSVITYARRYSWAAICGLGQEDDDGNEASKPTNKINEQQVTALNLLIEESKTNLKQLLKAYQVSDVANIPASKFLEIKSILEKRINGTGK